jgi:hypothetical protein
MTVPNMFPNEPDFGRCSRCGQGTGWEWDDYENAYVSVCCWAPAVEPDISWMEE